MAQYDHNPLYKGFYYAFVTIVSLVQCFLLTE